ncbi:unnamed protein product, partial [Ilex paraguariensis]
RFTLPRNTRNFQECGKIFKSSPTTNVDEEIESVEDLQDAYNELFKECLKQAERLVSFSTRLKMSEDEKKELHVELVNSKAHIVGLEVEKKFLHDKVNEITMGV